MASEEEDNPLTVEGNNHKYRGDAKLQTTQFKSEVITEVCSTLSYIRLDYILAIYIHSSSSSST
jgi:hypothetical protein